MPILALVLLGGSYLLLEANGRREESGRPSITKTYFPLLHAYARRFRTLLFGPTLEHVTPVPPKDWVEGEQSRVEDKQKLEEAREERTLTQTVVYTVRGIVNGIAGIASDPPDAPIPEEPSPVPEEYPYGENPWEYPPPPPEPEPEPEPQPEPEPTPYEEPTPTPIEEPPPYEEPPPFEGPPPYEEPAFGPPPYDEPDTVPPPYDEPDMGPPPPENPPAPESPSPIHPSAPTPVFTPANAPNAASPSPERSPEPTPISPPPSANACRSSNPDATYFSCAEGYWVSTRPIDLPQLNVPSGAKIKFFHNLTTPTIIFTGFASHITSLADIQNLTSIVLSLTSADITILDKAKKDQIQVSLITREVDNAQPTSQTNSVDLSSVRLNLKTKSSGCKRISVEKVKPTKNNITAMFAMNKSKCNLWWIILISVIGGIIILAVIAIVLAATFIPSFKEQIRPYVFASARHRLTTRKTQPEI